MAIEVDADDQIGPEVVALPDPYLLFAWLGTFMWLALLLGLHFGLGWGWAGTLGSVFIAFCSTEDRWGCD